MKNTLLSLSTALLLVSMSACGGGDTPQKVASVAQPKVTQLPASSTVQEAFDTFNNFDFKNATKTTENDLVTNLKNTLNNPVAGDTSPDIATALAMIELFDLAKDPVISKYFTISLKDYPSLVSSLTDYSNSNDVNTLIDANITTALSNFDLGALIGKGFSYDLPEPAHKAAQKFKNLSDALAKSFPEDDYTFRYWATNDFDGYTAKYLRVGLLTSAATLELISSYSYGVKEDYGTKANNYSTVLYDPVSVLNAHKVFVFPDTNATNYDESVKRLKNAKELLTEALTLSNQVDISKLPKSDTIDYYASRKEIQAILANLNAVDGTKTTYNYDLGSGKPYLYLNLQALFDPNTVIDIKDFGDSAFIYDCNNSLYDLSLSENNTTTPLCSDGSIAKVRLDDVNVAPNITDSETNFDELVTDIVALFFHFNVDTGTLMTKLFETINDAAK